MRIVIPTMPARSEALWQLTARLGNVFGGAHVRVLPSTGDSREDVRRTVMAIAEARGPWALLMEDDAWPCDDFGTRVDGVRAHLRGMPSVAGCSLFSRRVNHVDPGFYTQPPRQLAYCVGIVLRPKALRGMASWLPGWYAANPQHYHAMDNAIGEWLALREWGYCVHSPSLVQHREGPSSFKGRGHSRMSSTYTAAYGDAPPMP